MIATLVCGAFVLAGFAMTVFMRQYESNPVVFLVVLACAVYVAAGAINAIMLGTQIAPRLLVAAPCVAAVVAMLWRRRRRAPRSDA